MQSFSISEFNEMLNSGRVTPYSVYDLDVDYQQYYSIKHYIESQNDTMDKDQKLNILFQDIEVFTNHANQFPEVSQARFPISAITIYSTFEKIFHAYFLLQHSNINLFPNKEELPKLIDIFRNDLIENNYIDKDDKIEMHIFTNEMDMVKSCWEKIRVIDPTVLSGWFSDTFDLPYTYFRLSNLLNKNDIEVSKILSRFGKVKVTKYGGKDFIINIPEYPVLDLLHLYKPRDDGGLNMGQKLSSYSLDFVSDEELSLKKLDYKQEGMSLDKLYETDPITYIKYNIIDVCLVKKLNHKLRHVESYNMLRRLMKTSFTNSLRGSTILFDTYVNYKLNSENKHTRFGIVEETDLSIDTNDLSGLYIPKSMNLTVNEIPREAVKSVLGRYPGAYVKDSKAQIVTSSDGIIIDSDASSLYPSKINELNISFDTFFGKVLDPLTYNFIATLKNHLGQKKLPTTVHVSMHQRIVAFTNKLQPQNKGDFIQYCYLIMAYLIQKLETYNKPINKLFKPETIHDYMVLKRYLLPLIDLVDETHESSKEYNSFCNEYLINNSIPKIQELLIVENILQPTVNIVVVPPEKMEQYLKNNNLILSLSGCLFNKHEVNTGLFIDFLKNLKSLRNQYEAERDKYPETSEEFAFYDMRQKAIKITMNTTYG